MRVRVTKRSLDWLASHHIFLSNVPNKVRLREKGLIRKGDWVEFEDDVEVEPYIGIFGGNSICRMGSFSYSNSPLPHGIRVGRYCSISWGMSVPLPRHPIEFMSTSIFTSDRDNSLIAAFIKNHDPAYDNFFEMPQKALPIIHDDVWIGANVVLMPGVVIGTGSVVAANSVVTKSVGPYEVIGGNPARLIRKRFPDEVINALLESKWWEYKFTDFQMFKLDVPEAFLQEFALSKRSLEPWRPPRILLREILS